MCFCTLDSHNTYSSHIHSIKDAKCIGPACIGCIKHSCDINGTESFFQISNKQKDSKRNIAKSDKLSTENEKCHFENRSGKKIDLEKLPIK